MAVRTQDEILARITEVGPSDWLGTQQSDLIECLDFEHAQPFLKDGVAAEEWTGGAEALAKAKDRAKEYLPFAMGKADGHRGISASRAIDHFKAWAWLSGDEAFIAAAESDDYPNYGAPILKAVALALDAKDIWDAHSTPELENMALGRACDPDCQEGCDR